MASTYFTAGTVVASTWLNDVNKVVYYNEINAATYFTEAELTAIKAYNYSVDCTAKLQQAMDDAYAAESALYVPAGGYLVTGLTIPGTNNSAGKSSRFHIYGEGFGEVGVIAVANKGTFLKNVSNAPIFKYTTSTPGVANGSGEVDISYLAMWGNSSTPIIDLDTFFGLCSLHHNNIAQDGTGSGVVIGWGATYDIHHNYIVGASYTANGLGAARTGIGLYIEQDLSSSGLQIIRQNTSAGWHTAYKLGSGSGTAFSYSASISMCEAAYCYVGVHLSTTCEGATVSGCYFEGQDAGFCVLDEGNYNRVENNWFFFSAGTSAGYTMLSSTTASKHGSRYQGNIFYLFNIPNCVGIDVTSSDVDGGPGKVVSRNHFILSAGTAGVIGLRINGVDPRIEATSNDFQPAGAWTGSGTYSIRNLSTASDTTTGTGVYGLSQAVSRNQNLKVPQVSRGAVNLAVEPDVLDNTDVASGVLTLGELSVYTFTPTSNVAITEFAAPNLPDKTFSIHVTATLYTVTFTNGTKLKLTGFSNIATGANGAWLTFQVKPGGVAWLTSHVAY
jgi:hypothetical protein